MKLRIQARFTLIIVGLMVILVGVLYGALFTRYAASTRDTRTANLEAMSRALLDRTTAQGASLARALAEALANPLYDYNLDEIANVARWFREHEDSTYLVVFDEKGELAHDGTREFTAFGQTWPGAAVVLALAPRQVRSWIEGGMIHLATPVAVGTQVAGGVMLGLSLAPVHADIASARRTLEEIGERGTTELVVEAGIVVILVAFLGIAASLAVAGGLSRPIVQFANLAREIGAGHYDVQVPVHRDDEIGDLARALTDTADQRKKADAALHDSEQRFKDIAEAASDWFWEMDADLRFTYVSARPDATAGPSASPAGMVGKTPWDLGGDDPVSDVEWWRFLDDLLARRSFRHIEFAAPRPDGEVGYASISGRPVVDDAGRFKGYRGSWTDVTARKRAESALRESEHHLAEAQRIAHIGHWQWNVLWGEYRWSKQMTEILGLPEATPASRDAFVATLHPEDRNRVVARLERALARGGPYSLEFRIVRADGAIRFVHCFGEVGVDPRGRPLADIGTLQDVTERRLAENELRLAKDHAERANRAKTEFLSNMSHELRTPLNSVLGFAQLLELNDVGLTPGQKEYISHILTSGRHLLDLINDVLELSRVEAGQIGLALEDVAPSAPIAESFAATQAFAATRGIALVDGTAGKALPVVRVDRTRFKQVLINLLSNAVKYNRPDGRVEIKAEDRPDGMLRVAVADTGTGIASERRDELFKRFSRLGAEASAIEGTGIGLAVTKKLVELMGGRIGFESEVGKGSTFWIDVPVLDPAAQAPAVAAKA